MHMRYLVSGLSLVNGLWMLIDGIYVILNGKYIGPEKPGPWASLISQTGIDVFKLGPLFVLFGIGWLVFVGAFWSKVSWAKSYGTVLSVATLWYLPFGTMVAVFVLIALTLLLRDDKSSA